MGPNQGARWLLKHHCDEGRTDRLPSLSLARHDETAWSLFCQHSELSDLPPIEQEGVLQVGIVFKLARVSR
jgi:hypothetical protein